MRLWDAWLLSDKPVPAKWALRCGAVGSFRKFRASTPGTLLSIRARTPQCILECANKSLELEDIEVRTARLEESEGATFMRCALISCRRGPREYAAHVVIDTAELDREPTPIQSSPLLESLLERMRRFPPLELKPS